MPKFSFEGVDENGQEVNGSVEEPTEEAAIASIREAGYYATKIEVLQGDQFHQAVWEPHDDTASVSAPPPARPSPAFQSHQEQPAPLRRGESLRPYSTPLIAALHMFAGGISLLAFLALIGVAIFQGATGDRWSQDDRQNFLVAGISIALLMFINFGIAQIIDIIAKGSHAAQQQVVLMRQWLRSSGEKPDT